MLKKTILFLLIFIFTIISCKRYEDGPLLSFRTVTTRLNKMAWRIKSFNVNGIDSTTFYDTTYFADYFFSYHKEDDCYYVGVGLCLTKYLNDGLFTKYTYENNKNHIIFSNEFPNLKNKPGTDQPLMYLFSGKWEIMRLTSDDFWIEKESNGLLYDVRFYSLDADEWAKFHGIQ